jgi:hypothetical protein
LTAETLAKYHAVKEAVTLRFIFIVTLHAPEPLQSPDQEEKVYPVAGDAVIVTELFVEYALLAGLIEPPVLAVVVR